MHRIGGTVGLDSEPRKVTEFTVDLPFIGIPVNVFDVKRKLQPATIFEYSFSDYPNRAEPAPFNGEVVRIFGLDASRCSSMDEAYELVCSRNWPDGKSHFDFWCTKVCMTLKRLLNWTRPLGGQATGPIGKKRGQDHDQDHQDQNYVLPSAQVTSAQGGLFSSLAVAKEEGSGAPGKAGAAPDGLFAALLVHRDSLVDKKCTVQDDSDELPTSTRTQATRPREPPSTRGLFASLSGTNILEDKPAAPRPADISPKPGTGCLRP